MPMISRDQIEDNLAAYIAELGLAAVETTYAEDRKTYTSHLAAAATMFCAVRRSASLADLKKIVAQERHNFGWGHLSGDCGNRAEAAFHNFASFVDVLDEAG